jgi:hypothetical protein
MIWKGKSNIKISCRNVGTSAAKGLHSILSFIYHEWAVSLCSSTFRNSLIFAIDESLPKIEALFAVGVLNSALFECYILVRKYESSFSEGFSEDDFEFRVASSCSSWSSQVDEGSCASLDVLGLIFRKNFCAWERIWAPLRVCKSC